MDPIVLKQEIVDKIKNDPILFGKIAQALDVRPSTLPRILQNNDPRLTQANCLMAISSYLEIEDTNELLNLQAA